jgi:hypothetical protein
MPETRRPTKITFLGATLLAASLTQTAAVAAERHRATRARAPASASQQKANNQVVAPSPAEENREYWRGRGLSFGGQSALRW